MLFNLLKAPYLNADSEIGSGGDGFDEPAETVEEVATETEDSTETAEDTTKAEEVTESPKYKLKYNHEEKEVSLDELTVLGQKGMNYDRLQEKFDAIQNNPALAKYSKVEEISKLLGYQTDDELLDALYQTHYERTAETQGLTPAQIQKEYELSQKEKAIQAKEITTAQQQKQNKMYADFATNFPDTKAEMIKPETWTKVNAGMDLSTAYTMQQNQDLQAELKIFKQNAENAKKAPIGSVSTHGSEASKSKDPFEMGFDSVK
jgi:hypothetical protein